MSIGMAIAALLLPCGELPLWGDESDYLPPNLYLVQATTLSVKNDADPEAIHQLGRLRITGVLAGPRRLVGKDFECHAGDPFPFQGLVCERLPNVVYFLEEGTEGLWWVYDDGRTLRPELRYEKVKLLRLEDFPYQRMKTPGLDVGWDGRRPRMVDVPFNDWSKVGAELRRKEKRAWAEAVAEVYSAGTDADRRALLMRYAAAPGSPVSGWAIVLLSRGPKEEAVRFFRGLAGNDRLDPDAQAILDRELCHLDLKGWHGDPLRRALFRRWLDPKASGYAFVVGCERVMQVMEEGKLDAEGFADAVRAAVAESDLLNDNEAKMHALIRLVGGGVRYTETDRKAGFAFHTDIIRTAKVPRLRSAAADGLEQFRPATEDELKVVKKLRENEPDREVRDMLDHVLEELRTDKGPG